MFCVSLNTTVVAPAMSIIATELNALEQQTWVATAYLLIFNAIQPISGKFSDIFGRKPILLFGLLMFCVGSLINSLANQMTILIAGRTVQGLGGGCIMSLAFILITDLSPPHLRPRFQSLLTVIYGLASCVGPLIGGAFVDRVSWHWDFWLNVILSVISFVLIAWLLKEPVKLENSTLYDKIKRIDWLGTLFSLGFVCCLLLALNWGPVFGWSDAHTIGAFVGAGVALIALVIVEGWVAKEPLMPGRVLTNPAVVILYIYMVCLGLGFIGTLYFGPVMFQSVFGADSMSSGIRLIPYMACLIVASVGSGYLLSFFPYIKFYLVFGASINLLGFGLFYTVNETSTWGQQAGFLTFCGFCFGLSQSNVILAVQSSSERRDMAVATGLNNFFLILASSVGVAIYQALFQLFLAAQFLHVDSAVLATANEYGALKNYLYIRKMPIEAQKPIIHAYSQALHTVFIIPLVASGLGLICALFIKNVKYQPQPSALPAVSPETKENHDVEKQDA
ncbi:major facilitator superfamily-domain-containing protein [Absidia repens]|uniref:MFS-type drug efflux transporter P55 n=1 Tax=Absidia repens TaxID=90262 RepID=A0A1X2IEL6_9FUNG|nr:major facilitator superfamily-domain-containing protein [Absidia repens]